MALLLWANPTGIALLAGIALAAQLEAARVGRTDPLLADTDDGIPDELDEESAGPPDVDLLVGISLSQGSDPRWQGSRSARSWCCVC
jgi:hypothetical protein